ncbi:MAG TPA: hypothetical protein VFJ71_11430 [Candidatus Limnocylindrales bacterium]|nr:hypothetical protein [Candidatus Limnocylindrales bacterium]
MFGNSRGARLRVARLALFTVVGLLLLSAGPVAAVSDAPARTAPKVVLIVGPVGSVTPYYRRLADEAAAAAAKYTPNVVKVYSPDATWTNVKRALEGASVVVYLGHGNGWPSIYRDSLYPPTQNGFGLNPHAGAADSHQYFGEDQIGSQIKLAPDAVVIFSHLCYASGNTEPGLAEGTLDQAQQRVDNYAAGFFRAGAGAVIADAYLAPTYYVRAVLRGRNSLERIWRAAPNRNDHFLKFASHRTKGAIAMMDPDEVDSGFHRSIVLKPRLTAARVLGGAVGTAVDALPIFEPSLAGLGVTFGSPTLSTPPTAGSRTTFTLPIAKDAIGLLPEKLMIATRWDPLDTASPAVPAAPGPAAPDGGTTPTTPTAAAPSDDDPGTTATDAGPSELVVPERTGEVVAPVAAKRVATGGIAVPVRVPATPGLYRLVATVHQPDGLAYDAATQALLPALIVRVTGPVTATYRMPTTATASAGKTFAFDVKVTNLGRSAWGHGAVVPDVGVAEIEPAQRATLVARWVGLGADPSAAAPASATVLPAGLAPGAGANIHLAISAPAAPGEYLLVLDVFDPTSGSLAALGVPPGIVRVTVTR